MFFLYTGNVKTGIHQYIQVEQEGYYAMTPKVMLRFCLKVLGLALLIMVSLRVYSNLTIMITGAGSFKALMDNNSLAAFTPLIVEVAVLLTGAWLCFKLADR